MKIPQLMTGRPSELEARKRALQRREMGEAYKKTAQYQSKKNPVLETLENLLSGKTEKEFYASESQLQEPTQSSIEKRNLDQREKAPETIVHEQGRIAVDDRITAPYSYRTGPNNDNDQVSIHSSTGSTSQETTAILEKEKQAANADSSPQDLQAASSALAPTERSKAPLTMENLAVQDDIEPFAREATHIEVPERFLQNFEGREVQHRTVFGKDLEQQIHVRQFKKALSIYSSHIEMVRNGYSPFNEPSFSRTA